MKLAPRSHWLHLNRLSAPRGWAIDLRRAWLRRVWKMDLDPTCSFSMSARFDMTYPEGVHVGAYTYLAFESRILTHDQTRSMWRHTRIGANCFIGGRSLIMPGVEIGDGCIVGAGAIVTRSVGPRCIVAGNPARVIRESVCVGRFGRLVAQDTPT